MSCIKSHRGAYSQYGRKGRREEGQPPRARGPRGARPAHRRTSEQFAQPSTRMPSSSSLPPSTSAVSPSGAHAQTKHRRGVRGVRGVRGGHVGRREDDCGQVMHRPSDGAFSFSCTQNVCWGLLRRSASPTPHSLSPLSLCLSLDCPGPHWSPALVASSEDNAAASDLAFHADGQRWTLKISCQDFLRAHNKFPRFTKAGACVGGWTVADRGRTHIFFRGLLLAPRAWGEGGRGFGEQYISVMKCVLLLLPSPSTECGTAAEHRGACVMVQLVLGLVVVSSSGGK